MPFRTFVLTAILLVGVVPARAQNPDDPTTSLLNVIKTLSQRVDALQARLDVAAGGVASGVFIETIEVRDYDQKISLGGWAFACNEPDARVVFVVDDVEVPPGFFAQARPERPDLTAYSSPGCAIGLHSGVNGLIDWTVFKPAPSRHPDLEHTVKIRIYDSHKKAKDSPARTVIMPETEGPTLVP